VVTSPDMFYIFVGEDNLSKEARLRKIKEEALPNHLENFNFDVLYAKDILLRGLQEKLLFLPIKSDKRVIVIKQAQALKADVKKFLSEYARKAVKGLIVVLDFDRSDPRDGFFKEMSGCSRVIRFREAANPDAFLLSRQIELKKADAALSVLNELFRKGERPERIMGGLRSSWERRLSSPPELKKRIRLLLNCDIDIKKGRLKPEFALERLVVRLCGLK